MFNTWNLVPNRSPQFRCVMEDDVAGLRELLMQRKATLWDRDERGHSMLSVCAYVPPRFCGRLIFNSMPSDYGLPISSNFWDVQISGATLVWFMKYL